MTYLAHLKDASVRAEASTLEPASLHDRDEHVRSQKAGEDVEAE